MYNDLFSIGPLTFHTYGLCTAIGILLAYFTAERRAKKKNLDADRIFGIVVFCCIFGYLGSKLLYISTILPQIADNPSLLKESLADGWVIYGGILGGIFGGWLYCRIRKLPAWKYFDLCFPSVALAQAIGRIGCFFAGCCYGEETDGPIYVEFSNSQFAPNHVHLIPTQLMSSAGDFLLWGFLLWYDGHRKKKDGEVTALYLIVYSVGRFLIEFLRGDTIRGQIGILSTSQFIGIFTALAGVLLLAARKLSPDETEAAQETVTEEPDMETGTTEKAAAEKEGENHE